MMNLWLLVILGSMANVANGVKYIGCTCDWEKMVEDCVRKNSHNFIPHTPINLSGFTNIIWGAGTSVAFTWGYSPEHWACKKVFQFSMGCKEHKNIGVQMSVTSHIKLTSLNGVLVAKLSGKPVVAVELTGPLTALVLAPLRTTLTSIFGYHCNFMIGIIIDIINRQFAGHRGRLHHSPYDYNADVQSINEKIIAITYGLTKKDTGTPITYEPRYPKDMTVPSGYKNGFFFPQSCFSAIIANLKWNMLLPIHSHFINGFFKGVEHGPLYVRMSPQSPPLFVCETTGTHIALNMTVVLHSKKSGAIATASVLAFMKTIIHSKNGLIGLEVVNYTKPCVIKMKNTHSSCGCTNEAFKSVYEAITNMHLLNMVMSMNCQMRMLLSWPMPFGPPNPWPQSQCIPYNGGFGVYH